MPDLVSTLTQRLQAAVVAAFGADFASVDPLLRRSVHADYQANLAMGLKDRVGQPPRKIADAIVQALQISDLCDSVSVAGPGFINLQLNASSLAAAVRSNLEDPRLGVPLSATPETVVIDYSAPNVAKEMHVGHIRSTVLGDALARILRFVGHHVIPQNHIGDWGTPFGMLIEHLLDVKQVTSAERLSVDDLDAFYVQARAKFDADALFADRARQRVVALQAGDAETLELWKILVAESQRHFQAVYEKLHIELKPEDARGESAYNDALAEVVSALADKQLLVESDGALCVFPGGFQTKDGSPLPLIVRKKDGGYGYAATDLAALRYRVETLGATRLLYVVGAPQEQHFAMVFAVGAQAGWLKAGVRAEHVAFGSILGADGKPLRTREGGSVKLKELLAEAERRGTEQVCQRQPELDAATQAELGAQVGIGAIKYADLSNERIKNYVFDWERMLAAQGNTGPYLQYAHARLASIFRKAADIPWSTSSALLLQAPEERALALELLQLAPTLNAVTQTLHVHKLCTYLFELASAVMQFVECCPVLRAETDELRQSRLLLAHATLQVLRKGFELLGLEAPSRM